MSLTRCYERTQGVPLHQRAEVIALTAAVSYLAVAAVVMFYLLPVGFALEGAELLLAQVGAALVGAAVVAYVATTARRGIHRRAALWALAADAGWEYVADVSDRIWGGSIDEQIERSMRSMRSTTDYLSAAEPVPFDTAVRVLSVGEGQGARLHTTRMVRIPLSAEAPRITLRSRRGTATTRRHPWMPGRTIVPATPSRGMLAPSTPGHGSDRSSRRCSPRSCHSPSGWSGCSSARHLSRRFAALMRLRSVSAAKEARHDGRA
ncbi:MAG TPA: hypothetical protein VN035_10740 [Microbacterium sp.]|nr:hypothetical protein [Microbacterium sp.]